MYDIAPAFVTFKDFFEGAVYEVDGAMRDMAASVGFAVWAFGRHFRKAHGIPFLF